MQRPLSALINKKRILMQRPDMRDGQNRVAGRMVGHREESHRKKRNMSRSHCKADLCCLPGVTGTGHLVGAGVRE